MYSTKLTTNFDLREFKGLKKLDLQTLIFLQTIRDDFNSQIDIKVLNEDKFVYKPKKLIYGANEREVDTSKIDEKCVPDDLWK